MISVITTIFHYTYSIILSAILLFTSGSATVLDKTGFNFVCQVVGDMVYENTIGQRPDYFLNYQPRWRPLTPPSKNNKRIKILSDKAIIIDEASLGNLYEKDATEPQAMASITKLMSAMVFLDQKPNLNSTYKMTVKDKRLGGKLHLYNGDEVTLNNLLHSVLVSSDNSAAAALIPASGLTEIEFVNKMNLKAQQWRLTQMKFVEPTGLDAKNIGTAREIAIMASKALEYPEIKEIVTLKKYQFETIAGKKVDLETTDDLVGSDSRLIGGKTGSLNEAGYCFVGLFEDQGRRFVSVILNAPNDSSRFQETKRLIDWAFKNY